MRLSRSLHIFMMIFVWGMLCVITPKMSHADDSVLNPALLSNEKAEVNLKRHLYVIPDTQRNLNFRSIIFRLNDGSLMRHRVAEDVLRLPEDGTPIWVVIPIQNQSAAEYWTLDFGGAMNGRFGFLSQAILYLKQGETGRTIFNASDTSNNNDIRILPTSIPIRLTQGQTSYLILYAQGAANSFVTLSPRFRNTIQHVEPLKPLTQMGSLLFLLSATLLLCSFFLKLDKAALYLGLMWLVLFIHRVVIDSYMLISGPLGLYATPLVWTLIPLLFLYALTHVESVKENIPTSVFWGLGGLSLVCIGIGLGMGNIDSSLALFLTYGPVLIIATAVAFIGWPFVLLGRGEDVASFVLVSSVFIFCGVWMAAEVVVGFNSLQNLSDLVPWLLALTALASALLHVWLTADHKIFAQQAAQNSWPDRGLSQDESDIRTVRENAEHKRLMQVLDQERATMRELQIKEAKRADEMRRAKEAADEANRAKSAFLAVVSHEIRTPMTGIMGMVRLLQETSLTREQKNFAVTIQDSGEALMALLNDILDFEKIESGKMELEHIPFDLTRLLQGIQTLMNGHAASKNISLELHMDPDIPTYMMGDPTRLRQVLLNLVSNAIKFTARGKVRIHVKDVTAADDKTGSIRQIYFSVQDSGIGMTQEIQRKLFMPFAQADASTARKYGGTGLGLAICKRLIEAMGGSISISSREGEGSTFFFSLSLAEAENDTAHIPPPTSQKEVMAAIPALRVLVVDDNGINQKVLTSLLNKHHHAVTCAANGQDALKALQTMAFDVVLLDVELPDISGVEVTNIIRNDPTHPAHHLPIIAITGNVGTEDIAHYRAAGMQDVLAKPVTPETLHDVLRRVAAHEFSDTARDQSKTSLETNDPDEVDDFENLIKNMEDADPALDMAQAGITQATLTSLLTSLGKATTRDLLQGFFEKGDELVRSIGVCYVEKDLAALAARAHELRGMAGNFGFDAVANLAGAIETAGKAQDLAEATEPVAHIAEKYAVAKTTAQNWLKSHD